MHPTYTPVSLLNSKSEDRARASNRASCRAALKHQRPPTLGPNSMNSCAHLRMLKEQPRLGIHQNRLLARQAETLIVKTEHAARHHPRKSDMHRGRAAGSCIVIWVVHAINVPFGCWDHTLHVGTLVEILPEASQACMDA